MVIMPRRLPSNDSAKNKAMVTGGGRPDYGTAERWQHGVRMLQPTENAGQFAAQVMEEHVLDRLVVLHVMLGCVYGRITNRRILQAV